MDEFWLKIFSMYNHTSILFWYKFIFIAEVFVVELIIGRLFEKKSRFGWRLAGVLAVLCVVIYLLPILFYNAWYLTVLFMVMFLLSVFMLKVLYKENFNALMICGIFAYSIQHIAYSAGNYLANISGDGFGSVYTQHDFNAYDMRSLTTSISLFLLLACIVFGIVILYANKNKKIKVNNALLCVLAGVMFVVNDILNSIAVYEFTDTFSKLSHTVFFFYDIISTSLVVLILLFAIADYRIRDEMKMISILYEKDKQIYKIKKEKIDTVNVMCHDLRNQINKMRENRYDVDVLSKIENSLNAYVPSHRTGNEVLDIILNENSIFCNNFGINLIYIGDGGLLRGVPDNILYSLFENLLNNAIDAAKDTAQGKEKFIKIVISEQIQGVVKIHIENSYNGEPLKFEHGLPQSTHSGSLHGYGFLGIQMQVENLDGAMNIQTKDGVFYVNIVFSSPKQR